jgi:SAM-dependent methyltransferase
MQETPINREANLDIPPLVPTEALRIVEIGCSGGGLAREIRRRNSGCRYVGIEIVPEYATVAREHCSDVLVEDIERMPEDAFVSLLPVDCWIFADVLEHLYDPWAVLRRIRTTMSASSSIVACIPNAQHWSVQARLASGLFRYEERGLMDQTHIRWFTRRTIDELFSSCGMRIADGIGRILEESHREAALDGIAAMAKAIGADVAEAVNDAIPLQWVVRAVPVDAPTP